MSTGFQEALRQVRESAQLSQVGAAQILRLTLSEYRDREGNQVGMNFPERCGMLVGLGMDLGEAIKIAGQMDAQSTSLASPEINARMMTYAGLVRETDEAFIFEPHEYTILKSRVRTPENVLGWVAQLAGKGWVTRDHLGRFVELASTHLGVSIHPLP